MVSTAYDPVCTRCGHLRSLHKHVERPDIWWCSGNGMGAGRCLCPVFSDDVPEPPALNEDDLEPEQMPFEMSFVFVKRGESLMWSAGKPATLSVPARAVELTPAQAPNGCISLVSMAEIRDYRLDCVIDDGALSGRQAAWVAVLAGLRVVPTPEVTSVHAGGVTFAPRLACEDCNRLFHLQHVDDDGDRMFNAYDTIAPEAANIIPAGELFYLQMHFDPAALKKDEQIPIGFLRVVMSGMLIADGDFL